MTLHRQQDNWHVGLCLRILVDFLGTRGTGDGDALTGKLRAGDWGGVVPVVEELSFTLGLLSELGGTGTVGTTTTDVPLDGSAAVLFAGTGSYSGITVICCWEWSAINSRLFLRI